MVVNMFTNPVSTLYENGSNPYLAPFPPNTLKNVLTSTCVK